MNALELLKTWPDLAKANAETVFASSAWRLNTDYGGEAAVLTKREHAAAAAAVLKESTAAAPGRQTMVTLEVLLDGTPRRLSIFDSPSFPDLHLLAGRLAALPSEVVLALLEKECGTLLQTIENVFRRKLTLSRLTDAGADAKLTAFELSVGDRRIAFAVELDPSMVQTLGKLKNLDPAHEAIRSLTRDVEPEYAEFELSEAQIAALKVGDRLIVPEEFVPRWRLAAAADDRLHLCGAPEAIAFAAFADEALPPVPPPQNLTLFHRGSLLATGRLVRLGSATAFEILSL